MAFIDDVINRLVASNVGTFGQNIFMSSKAVIPPLPATGPFLTIIETGGTEPTRTQNMSGAATQRPTAQITTRATTYAAARAMAKAAYDALDGLYNVSLSGTQYLRIVARQEPTDIGVDDVGRPRVVFNVDAEKQPS
jgi:hypothetical protein